MPQHLNGPKRALITGITGQDGSYLTELLLEKGYEVHGLVRRSSSLNTARIDHLYNNIAIVNKTLFLHFGDLMDHGSLMRVLSVARPDEVYNLAAQSHVMVSFELPEYTGLTTGIGCQALLNAIREYNSSIRFYQASSSEMFGRVKEVPQSETTPFYPRSPYGCAKVYAYWCTINYREAYGLHASNGILFNHESPRRGETFVSRKITRAIARILGKKQDLLLLGNLEARRDWGYAKDYVRAMWLMLQQPDPDEYVIATGQTHSVKEFLDEAFGIVGLDWKKYVRHDSKYFRPTEVDLLLGDPSKARKKLHWVPQVGFKDLIKLMVCEDLKLEGIEPKDFGISDSELKWVA